MPQLRSVVLGVGAYLPQKTLTNDELAKLVDTSDAWIVQRTGIKERHIAAEGETTSMLGEMAARDALANAGIAADDIDLIVVATSTPDWTFPSTATQIQAALGITHGVAFDLQAVCSGFCFRRRHGGEISTLGLAQARACDRRRDVLPDHRLDRPHHLRAVWRRRRRDGARGATVAGRSRRARRADDSSAL